MAKRKLQGIITSDKMQETAVVAVSHIRRHPKYLKEYTYTVRLKAHNSGNKYKIGEKVVIEESRPLSKQKHWIIIQRV